MTLRESFKHRNASDVHVVSEWSLIDSGEFQKSYIDRSKKRIFHRPVALLGGQPSDLIARDIRVWKEINPSMHPVKPFYSEELGAGWIRPFIQGEQASDAEISQALIDIFNKTGRIVVNAMLRNTFIKKDSMIICNNTSHTLKLENLLPENKSNPSFFKANKRRSLNSMCIWKNLEKKYQKAFDRHQNSCKQTIHTLQALLFIKQHYPNLIEVSFLKEKPEFIRELAHHYTKDYNFDNKTGLLKLYECVAEKSLTDIKERCLQKLRNWIVKKEQPFPLAWCMKVCGWQKTLTQAKSLMVKINLAISLEALTVELETAKKNVGHHSLLDVIKSCLNLSSEYVPEIKSQLGLGSAAVEKFWSRHQSMKMS